MHDISPHLIRLTGLAACLALVACHAPSQPQASAVPAPQPRRQAPGIVLALYSGSLTGLVVGSGPDGGNPGAQLAGQVFVPNPGLPQTYIWAFTPDAAILDRDCHKVTLTEAINVAEAPVANAARFEAGSAADGRPASIRVQIWPKSGGTPPSCGTPAAS